jgi:hypothetical protein
MNEADAAIGSVIRLQYRFRSDDRPDGDIAQTSPDLGGYRLG